MCQRKDWCSAWLLFFHQLPCAGLQAQIFAELPTINLKLVWLLEEKNTLCSMHVTFLTADYTVYQHVRLVHVAFKGYSFSKSHFAGTLEKSLQPELSLFFTLRSGEYIYYLVILLYSPTATFCYEKLALAGREIVPNTGTNATKFFTLVTKS